MPHRTGIVTASLLNVRREPSTAQPPVGVLHRGDRVTITGQSGSWYAIAFDGGTAYVYGDFVRVLPSEPVAGFLKDQAELQTVPIAASGDDVIGVTPGMSWQQKTAARTWNRFGGLLGLLSDVTGVDRSAGVAVLLVESNGSGFAQDGRMIIRFENHVFKRQWGSAGDGVFPQHFRFNASKPWTGQQYRIQAAGSWRDSHGSQHDEWTAFPFARTLSAAAALRSISMGAPQIMGFNHARIGYDSAAAMFDRFSSDIRYHLLGLFDFIKGPGSTSSMLEALRRRQFEQFAAGYNGPGQAARYADRIRQYVEAFDAVAGA